MFKLRELNESDLETINKWRNDPELIINLGAPLDTLIMRLIRSGMILI